MTSAGVDVATLIQRCGLRLSDLQDKRLRTPHAAQQQFWQVLQELTQDPDIGLTLASHLPPYHGQVLEYLFLSSPNFGEGLRRAINYERLLSDALQGRLRREGDQAILSLNLPSDSQRPFIELLAHGVITFFQKITDSSFHPTALHFTFSQGASGERYQALYGCPVSLGSTENSLHFAAHWLDTPSPHAEPELLALHEQVASERVAELERQDLIHAVRRVIGEHLESGELSLECVAQQLGLRPRLLRSRLANADSSFNQILGDYRCRLAKRLLAGTDESIDQIVYLTGFSEPSTFYRAFRRWTDQTPVEYRRSRRGVNDHGE
nr:AraC family transcriptional regulator [Atopomonas sediminilitoris]